MMRPLPLRRYAALALALSAAIAALFAQVILTLRDEHWRHVRETNATLVHTIEQNIGRTLDGFVYSLEGTRLGLARPDFAALQPSVQHAVLFDSSLRLRGLGSVLVLDRAGDIVFDSAAERPRQANFSDRDYFRAHAQGTVQGLYISMPVRSRLGTSQPALPLSLAYRDAEGRFAGVVVGTIQIAYFEELFASVNTDAANRVDLWRSDGQRLATAPAEPARPAAGVADAALLRRLTTADHGTFTAADAQDGMLRLNAYRRVQGHPLVVDVSQPERTILAAWRRSAWLLGGFAALLVAASLGLAWLFMREILRRQSIGAQLKQAEHDLTTILHNLPSMVAYWDTSLRNRFANQAYLHWAGMTAEQLRQRRLDEAAGPQFYAQVREHVEQALQGHRQVFERTLRLPSGEKRHAVVTYIPDVEDGSVRGFFVQIDDLTERKQMEDLLFEEKELVRLTLQAIGDAVICTDAQGRVTYLNPVAERMTGWQAFDAAGQPVDRVAPLQLPGDAAAGASPIHRALTEGARQAAQRGVTLRRRDGTGLDVEESASPITDRHGAVTGVVMVLRDVTEAMELSRRLTRLAQYDVLTGLPNRMLLQDRAQQAIARARRDRHGLALMFIDLDGFKQVNDTLGHEAGDALLVQMARRFTAAVRESDTVCRQGGDEFVVLLPALGGAEQAQVVADKLMAACAEPFELDGHARQIWLSGGIALYPHHGDTFEALARSADAAMYAAKRSGRRQFRMAQGQGQAPEASDDAGYTGDDQAS